MISVLHAAENRRRGFGEMAAIPYSIIARKRKGVAGAHAGHHSRRARRAAPRLLPRENVMKIDIKGVAIWPILAGVAKSSARLAARASARNV